MAVARCGCADPWTGPAPSRACHAAERRRANDPLRATPAEVRGRLLNDSKRTPPPYPEDAKGLTGWVTLTSSGGGSGGGGGDKGKGNDRRERRKVNGKRGNSRQDPESTSGSVDKMICEHFLRTGYFGAYVCAARAPRRGAASGAPHQRLLRLCSQHTHGTAARHRQTSAACPTPRTQVLMFGVLSTAAPH